ncbi:MAG: hypothetical protein K2L51_00735, partial [Clostridiales bacterium]|nr:hypothetical protein [Clostridiales bacterium]
MKKDTQKHAGKFRSVAVIFILDVVFAFGAYCAARGIMFYRAPKPSGYVDYEWVAVLAMLIITLAMLVFFDCYNSVWKYAGRVEFFKFILAYFSSFGIIMLFKVIMKASFGFALWTPLALMYLLFSGICSGVMRFITGIVNYFLYVRHLMGNKGDPSSKRTVVIGAGYVGSLIINRFINNPGDGYFHGAFIYADTDKQGKRMYGIK